MNETLVEVLNKWTFRRVKNQIFESIHIVTMQNKINLLLPFGPAVVVLAHLSGADQYILEMGFIFQLVGNNTFA